MSTLSWIPKSLGHFSGKPISRGVVLETLKGRYMGGTKQQGDTLSHAWGSVLPPVHTEAEADQLGKRCEQQATSERETREPRERERSCGKPCRAATGARAAAATPRARAGRGRAPVPLLHAR